MRLNAAIILAAGLLFAPVYGYAGEADALYAKAIRAAKAGQVDFAFMYYNQLDRDYPDSPYREQVLFAKGEYFYGLPAFEQAQEAFNTLIQEYPKSLRRLFALVYLYNIADAKGNIELLESLKKEILTFRQVGLVFKETKEFKYPSPLYRNFRAVFYIDKIEFYRGGELFVTVAN